MSNHLSISSLIEFWSCPEKWRLNQIAKRAGKRVVTCDMLRGTATHAAIETALRQKGTPHTMSVATEVAAAVEKEWPLVQLRADEQVVGPEISKAHLLREAERAAAAYIKQEVPEINPIGIETAFDLTHPEWGDWHVIGRLDIVEDGLIRDVKTTKHPLSKSDENVAHDSDQLTMYALAYFAELGKIPKVQLDYIVLTERAHVVSRPSERTTDDLRRIVERVANTIRAIENYHSGLTHDGIDQGPVFNKFSPAVRGRWGACRANSCQFWSQCGMGGGRSDYSLDGLTSIPTKEEIEDDDA